LNYDDFEYFYDDCDHFVVYLLFYYSIPLTLKATWLLIEVKITILMIIILNIILIYALMYSIELFQGYFVIHNLIAIIFLLNEFPF